MLEPVLPCDFIAGSSYFETTARGQFILFTVKDITFYNPTDCKVCTEDYYQSEFPGKPITITSDSKTFGLCYSLPSAVSPTEAREQFPELFI